MTIAIVTGGSCGIGRAIAERLGADGATVVVNYHANRAAADQVTTAIERAGGHAVPLGRLGEPDDIADIVAFLTSDAARWITGETVHAGGGLF
jgi:3-oxoacyl-[acyl-carrier protein] reductase